MINKLSTVKTKIHQAMKATYLRSKTKPVWITVEPFELIRLDQNSVIGFDLLVLAKPFFEVDDISDNRVPSSLTEQYEIGDHRIPLLVNPRFERDADHGAPFQKLLMIRVSLYDRRTSEMICEGVFDFGQACGTRGRYGHNATLSFRNGETLRCFVTSRRMKQWQSKRRGWTRAIPEPIRQL